MSAERQRRMAHADEALALQTKGALLGATMWFGIGMAAATIAHFAWPGFRRQTLAFKAFLVTGSTTLGLCIGAETYLQAFERRQRLEENAIRREARYALANQGIIATESNIRKWRIQRDEALKAEEAAAAQASAASR